MALADIPGYGAYIQRRQMNEQKPLQELQQVGAVQGLLAKMQAQQKAQAYEAELAGLGPDATEEQHIAVASKYAGPEKLLTMRQGALDRKAQRELLVQTATDRRDQNKALMSALFWS